MDTKCATTTRAGTTTTVGFKGATIEIEDKFGDPSAKVKIGEQEPLEAKKSVTGQAFEATKQELSKPGVMPTLERATHLNDGEAVSGPNSRVAQTGLSTMCMK